MEITQITYSATALLRPTMDTAELAGQVVGGTALWQVWDEAVADDADYWHWATNPAVGRDLVVASSTDIPAGAEIEAVIIHYRAKATTPGVGITAGGTIHRAGYIGTPDPAWRQELTTQWTDYETDITEWFLGTQGYGVADLNGQGGATGFIGWGVSAMGLDSSDIFISQAYLEVRYFTTRDMTFADALIGDRTPIRWLLALSPDAGSTWLYFAEACRNVGNTPFVGALNLRSKPSITYDPYTGRASAGSVQVELAAFPDYVTDPTPRYPKDLAAQYGTQWVAWNARLYRWAEGTTGAEAQLLLDGYVRNPSYGADRKLSFTVVDKSVRWDVDLPRAFFDARQAEYGYLDPDENGFGFPLLYGPLQCRAVRSYMDKNGSDYVTVAHGKMHTIQAVYAGDVAQSFSAASFYTDPVHNIITTVVQIATLGDGVVTVLGEGQEDTEAGTVSGTSNAYLTHLVHQLHHLAIVCGLPNAQINTTAVAALVTALGTFPGALRVECTDTSSLMRIAQDVARLTRAFIGVEYGYWTMRPLDLAETTPVVALVEHVNVHSIEGVKWVSDDKLLTKLVLKHTWVWSPSDSTYDYRGCTEYGADDIAAFGDNLTALGYPNEEKIETKLLREEAGVTSAALLAALHSKTRQIIEVVADRSTHTLKICDTVSLTTDLGDASDGTGFTDLLCAVIGIEYGAEDNTLTLLTL